MMMATVENFPLPAEYAGWIACAAFTLWLILLAKKAVREFRGDEPQPPNIQLGLTMKDLKRRIETLERWKEELLQKLDDDKSEILAAGEERGGKIHDRINVVLAAVSKLEGRIEQFNLGRHR
jgi:hypothetical protein